jgi:C4-dicarboxylate-specific signal transduction histidine kinase
MQDLSLKAQMGALQASDVVDAERKIQETVGYLSDTINDFRSFAAHGMDYTQPGAFELGRTVEETIRLLSVMLADEKIEVDVDLPPREAMVKGSANDFKQVLMNLIYNAVDVFKERGVKRPKIWIAMAYEGHKAVITVRDNGGGISEKIIDKIFEPYFTTKYQARGTGLGLYMSKMIVEKRLNGRIEAGSAPEGAEFRIELPVMG